MRRFKATVCVKPATNFRIGISYSMFGDTTIVFGMPVPSVDPVFLAVVRFHIVFGMVCVAAGALAMLSRKGLGRHSTFGTYYYWTLAVLVASAIGLSVVRWTENYHLFFLSTLSL